MNDPCCHSSFIDSFGLCCHICSCSRAHHRRRHHVRCWALTIEIDQLNFFYLRERKKKTLSANGIARQIKKVLAPRMSVISLHITGTSIFLMPSNLTIFQTMREPLMHGLCILSWTNLYDFPVYMLLVSFTSKPSAFSCFTP